MKGYGSQRGRRHSRRYEYTPPKRVIIWKRLFLLCACCALILFGIIRLTIYLFSSAQERRNNEEIARLYEFGFTEAPVPAITEAPLMVSAPLVTAIAPSAAVPALSAPPSPTPGVALPKEYRLARGKMLSQMSKLFERNRDIIGWIQIDGVVSLPVMYRNNTYYLDRDFDKNKSSSGALFLDESHPLAAKTQYIVIHGHNMQDGSMFGIIPHYKQSRYIKEHGIARFSSLYEEQSYAAFAVIQTPVNRGAPNYVAYTGMPVFQTEAAFDAFISLIKKNSLFIIPIDIASSDALLALSTCDGDERIVVFFRKVRADESTEELRIKLNEVRERR